MQENGSSTIINIPRKRLTVVGDAEMVTKAANVDKAGLMNKALNIFEGGKNQTAGYHGMLDSTYFINWMVKLLQALADQNVQNALIVMDNANYHKSLPEATPKGKWKKSRMIEYCVEPNIPHCAIELISVIWGLKKHIEKSIKAIIVTMAEEAGHKVVWNGYCSRLYTESQQIPP